MYDSDPKLRRMYMLKEQCRQAISEMDDDELALYKARYDRDHCRNWTEAGALLNGSSTSVYRKRYAILSLLARAKNII